MKGAERRQYIRVFTSFLSRIRSDRGDVGEGQVVDLSLGGLRFVSNTDFSPKDNIRVDFHLPNGIACSLIGKIVAVTEGSPRVYGIKFSTLDPIIRQNMGEFIMTTKYSQDDWLKSRSS